MNRKHELTAEQQFAVDRFISKYLNPPPGKTPRDIKTRLQHWISVANNPSQLISGSDACELANVRRKARQNVRRLLQQHPELAEQPIAAELPEVAQ
jgi:hypothetical protein